MEFFLQNYTNYYDLSTRTGLDFRYPLCPVELIQQPYDETTQLTAKPISNQIRKSRIEYTFFLVLLVVSSAFSASVLRSTLRSSTMLLLSKSQILIVSTFLSTTGSISLTTWHSKVEVWVIYWLLGGSRRPAFEIESPIRGFPISTLVFCHPGSR